MRVLCPTGALPLCGDAARLAQVVGNLLDNASKYTPIGASIGLAVVGMDDGFAMTIDSGIGMAPDTVAQVFERRLE